MQVVAKKDAEIQAKKVAKIQAKKVAKIQAKFECLFSFMSLVSMSF